MHAVFVAGRGHADEDKDRFYKDTEKILKTLNSSFGIKSPDQYSVLRGSRQQVLSKLEEIFLEKRKEDILLVYIGHGQENGWALDGYRDWELVEYEQLAFVFAGHHGNLVLVNDCCFAGAAKKAMEHRFGEYLLIAAMPEDKIGCATNFLAYVLNDWSNSRNFYPTQSLDNARKFFPVMEGNENIQSLFFQKLKSQLAQRQDYEAK